MHRRMWVLGLVVVLALVVGAWSSGGSSIASAAPGPQRPEPQEGRGLDEMFADVAQRAPGFGGMFVEDGVLKVYVVDPSGRGAAEAAIAAVFGPERIPAGGVQILQARHGFNQLKAWQNRADALLSIDGVVYTDVDETSNRVKIGVEAGGPFEQVEGELRGLGVPRDAVEVVDAEAIVPMTTLRDRVRPLVGGLQINFPGYLCTYGFNATRAGVQGFVTNSHCTARQGGVDNTPYWQPTETADPTSIGTEIADPAYTRAKCPPGLRGKVCRYSDSAFVRLENGVTGNLGAIAQTTGPNNGSLTMAATAFAITTDGSSLVNETVNKVGRTTGWSQGRVTATCVNTGVQGSKIVQLCQTHVSASVGSGDSGSPVFTITGGTNVELNGILWGGSSSGSTFVFSPMSGITRSDELGPLTTH